VVNEETRVTGRNSDFAWIRVHPKDRDTIFLSNTSTYKSTDGGKNFTAIKGAPGGDDYHTTWINPNNPDIMLLTSDQGAVVTVNGGQTWSSWYNQPTAQIYHVATDNQFLIGSTVRSRRAARSASPAAATMAPSLSATGIQLVLKNMDTLLLTRCILTFCTEASSRNSTGEPGRSRTLVPG